MNLLLNDFQIVDVFLFFYIIDFAPNYFIYKQMLRLLSRYQFT